MCHFNFHSKDHFTNDQYEQNRSDGRRKLKPNAISSIFVYNQPLIKQRKPPKQRITNSRQEKRIQKELEKTAVIEPENMEESAVYTLHHGSVAEQLDILVDNQENIPDQCFQL